MPNLEAWLRSVTAEVSQVKAQVLFLRRMNVDEKGEKKGGACGGRPPS